MVMSPLILLPIPPTHPVLAIVVPRATLPPVVIVPVIVACRTEPASHPVPTAPALHLPVTEPALLQPGEVLGAATGPGQIWIRSRIFYAETYT